MHSNFFPPMQEPMTPIMRRSTLSILQFSKPEIRKCKCFANVPKCHPVRHPLFPGEQTIIHLTPFSLSRQLISFLIQNSPQRFFPDSPVFPLLVFDFDAEEADDAPEAAAVMAANLCLARSSPDSAAFTYHLLDSKGSRRQPMPISVK